MQKVAQALWREVIPAAPAFTTRRAAEAAHVSVDQASRDLGRLERLHLITRVTKGVWADTKSPRFSPYAVVPALVRLGGPAARGYVSLLSALSLHGMIQQSPRVIHVVVSRRMRRMKRTPIGTFRFHVMAPDLVGGFEPYVSRTFDIATPAKALFDTLYYSTRRASQFAHLPELALPTAFPVSEVDAWIGRIASPALRLAVTRRWHVLRHDTNKRPRDTRGR